MIGLLKVSLVFPPHRPFQRRGLGNASRFCVQVREKVEPSSFSLPLSFSSSFCSVAAKSLNVALALVQLLPECTAGPAETTPRTCKDACMRAHTHTIAMQQQQKKRDCTSGEGGRGSLPSRVCCFSLSLSCFLHIKLV